MNRRDDSVGFMTCHISVHSLRPSPSRRRAYHRGCVPEPVSRVLVFVLIDYLLIFSFCMTCWHRHGLRGSLNLHSVAISHATSPCVDYAVWCRTSTGVFCSFYSPRGNTLPTTQSLHSTLCSIYELFALGMEQLRELLANCYSPELGLRCRPCCFSQNNSGASPSAVQVLSMRTAHMNLFDNTLSSFFLVTITMMASCIRDYTHSRLSICALASTTKGELVCPI